MSGLHRCELYALNQALHLLKGEEETDSKYAYCMVHTFGKIWEEWGLINSKGKELVHGELIRQVLENLLLPIKIAIVHVRGHQKGKSVIAQSNRAADKTAHEAALQYELSCAQGTTSSKTNFQ